MTDRLTQDEIFTRAAIGMGRVDLWGLRGATLVTVDEIEAMALALAQFGLRPIRPDGLPEPVQPAPVLVPGGALAPLMGPADV
jgi:hypothetical protein